MSSLFEMKCRAFAAARAGLLVLLALAIAGCSLFGGDEDPFPPAELERFKSTLKVKRAWSRNIGGGTELLRLSLGPASNGDLIVAASHKGKVSAYSADKGRQAWRVKTKLPLSGGAGVDSKYVAVGSIDGTLVLLSIEDGSEIWRRQMSGEILSAPALTTGLVIVRTVDGRLTALSTEDGSEVWFIQQSMPRLSLRGSSAPIVIGGAVICGFDNGRLAAYDLSGGDTLWDVMLAPPSGRTEIERLIDLDSDAVVVGRDIYAVSFQGRLVSIAAEGGQILWAEDVSSYAGIAADSSSIYLSSERSELVSYSNASGRELWRSDTLLNRDITGPAKHGSSVVVGDFEGYLHWFDSLTGTLQARSKAGGDPVSTAPLVVGDMLYATTDGGRLVAYRIVRKK